MATQDLLHLLHEALLDGRVEGKAVGHETEGGGRGVVTRHVEKHALGCYDLFCQH